MKYIVFLRDDVKIFKLHKNINRIKRNEMGIYIQIINTCIAYGYTSYYIGK